MLLPFIKKKLLKTKVNSKRCEFAHSLLIFQTPSPDMARNRKKKNSKREKFQFHVIEMCTLCEY